MSQTYQARRRARDVPAAKEYQTSVPGPSMGELAAGAMPSTEQMGRRVELPDAIREKMEASFGADFSGVKLYESQTVADAGAEAMTMGSNVAFAPGQLDLVSTSGQALLGHELSHVVSQARGESAGRGFLADAGLEAQADRQGALAAQGESVYTGPVAPLSASAVPASAAGPMQAAKQSTVEAEKEAALRGEQLPSHLHFIQRSRAKQNYLDMRAKRIRMGELAGEVLSEVNNQNDELTNYAAVVMSVYMNTIGRHGDSFEHDYSRYPTRYLESGLKGKSVKEQKAMMDAFGRDGGRDEDLAPFLIQDIRRFAGNDSGGVLDEDDEKVMAAYRRDAQANLHQANVYDLLSRHHFDKSTLVGPGKLSQKELDDFMSNPFPSDVNKAAGLIETIRLMGSDSTYRAGKEIYDNSLPVREADRAEWRRWLERRNAPDPGPAAAAAVSTQVTAPPPDQEPASTGEGAGAADQPGKKHRRKRSTSGKKHRHKHSASGGEGSNETSNELQIDVSPEQVARLVGPADERGQAIEAYLRGGMGVHSQEEREQMYADLHPGGQGENSQEKLLQYVAGDIRTFLDTDIRGLNDEDDEVVKNAHGALSGIGGMMEGIQAVLPYLPEKELRKALGAAKGGNRLDKFNRKAGRFRTAMAGADATLNLYLARDRGRAYEAELRAEQAARKERRKTAKKKNFRKG